MTETAANETQTAEATEKKEKAPGVGAVAIALIREGKTNEEVLEAVRAQFPDAKTSASSINWYRNKLRSDGENVKTARELKKALAAENPPAEKPKRQRGKKASDAPAENAGTAEAPAEADHLG